LRSVFEKSSFKCCRVHFWGVFGGLNAHCGPPVDPQMLTKFPVHPQVVGYPPKKKPQVSSWSGSRNRLPPWSFHFNFFLSPHCGAHTVFEHSPSGRSGCAASARQQAIQTHAITVKQNLSSQSLQYMWIIYVETNLQRYLCECCLPTDSGSYYSVPLGSSVALIAVILFFNISEQQ
jgi:hypothetical protein